MSEHTELKVLESSVWDTMIDSEIASQIHHLRFDPRAEAGSLSVKSCIPAQLESLVPNENFAAYGLAMWGRNRGLVVAEAV